MRMMKTAVLALCILLLAGSLAFGADTVKMVSWFPDRPAAADGTSALYPQIALDQVNAAGVFSAKK